MESSGVQISRPRALYLGVFLVSLLALVLQVVTTRLFSVLTWYHLAFLVISLAMLGMTAAGLYVYLRRDAEFPRDLSAELSSHATALAFVIPLSHLVLISLPIPTALTLSADHLGIMTLAIAAAAAPYFFSGVAIVLALSQPALPMGRIYGFDLLGAGSGCLLAIVLLERLDPSTISLLLASFACLSAVAFAVAGGYRPSRAKILLSVFFAAATLANSATPRPVIYVPRMQGWTVYNLPVVRDQWNSHSRVVVFRQRGKKPYFWGRGDVHTPLPKVLTVGIQIDGSAYTPATAFDANPETVSWVRQDVTSLPYHLHPHADVAIIGVGGGRDVLTALNFGARSVTGLEVNGIIVDALHNDLRELTKLVDRPDVEIRHAEGRSWMASTDRSFDLIQMSLIDTFASTSAGAMTLTESGLYTVECWEIFLDRLNASGVLSVSRYFAPGRVSETARLLSLATAVVLERGGSPREQIILASAGPVATLMVAKKPFRKRDVSTLRRAAERYGFDILVAPGQPVSETLLRPIVESRSMAKLEQATANRVFDLSPARDDRPYFFNMLKPWARYLTLKDSDRKAGGVVAGNLRASNTLVVLLVSVLFLVIVTIVLPLLWKGRSHDLPPPVLVWSGLYFSLIGLGFMLIEIAQVQRYAVLLGHPSHSMAVTLMSMIVGSGAGSLASDSLPLDGSARLGRIPIGAALLIGVGAVIGGFAVSYGSGLRLPLRVGLAFATTFPVGFALGVFFPIGMRLLEGRSRVARSWMWGLNGAFGVLGSLVAVVISMTLGIRACMIVGGLLYLVLSLPLRGLLRAHAAGEGARAAAVGSGIGGPTS